MTPRMTPDRTWDPVRFQRGTRGFAAFVTALDGFIVLGVAGVVAPASDLPDPAMAWVVILGLVSGLAHFVAVIGLIRARRWARSLVGYLAAAGIGAATFGLLMIGRAEEPVLGAVGATAIGYLLWMIGSWLVAARLAFKGYASPSPSRSVAPHRAAVATVPPAGVAGSATPRSLSLRPSLEASTA